MADLLSVALLVLGLLIVALLVAIYLRVRRPAGLDPTYLQVLQPMKQQADQRLPLIEKQTSDIGQYVMAIHKQRTEEEKVVRESLAKLQEATKNTPQFSQQLAVVQNELKRLQSVEQGVRDLNNLFLSTQGRGQMGEEAVRVQFQALPHEMWSEQYALGGGKVDFAVHLPNKRILPIDSKTSGLQPILDYYELGVKAAACTNAQEKEELLRAQGKLQTRIRQAVLSKTYEVAAYIQPQEGTLGLAIQAVPDSLYGILDIKTRKEASELNVQIVPYGLLLPVAHILRAQNQFDKLDFQAIVSAMQGIRLQSNAVRDVLVNKFQKAQKYLESGIEDVEGALDAIERNANDVGDTGANPSESRIAIKQVRAKLQQKGLEVL